MSESAEKAASETGTTTEAIICPKCGRANARGGRRCTNCSAHLYVRCHYCRRRNERGAVVCVACGEGIQGKRSFTLERTRFVWLAVGIVLFLILGVVIANYFTPAPQRVIGKGHAEVIPPALTNEDDSISNPLQQLNQR